MNFACKQITSQFEISSSFFIIADAFSDEGGSQLQVFLGTTLGFVGSLMTLVTVCLILVWKRERLPKVETNNSTPDSVVRLGDQDGRLLSLEPQGEIEDAL